MTIPESIGSAHDIVGKPLPRTEDKIKLQSGNAKRLLKM